MKITQALPAMQSQARAIAIAALCGAATPALAYSAHDAADCAAFNMANWDYEVEAFSPEDRSAGWKDQSAGFAKVAQRLGMSRTDVNTVIQTKRGPMLKLIQGYIFGDNRKQKQQFNRLSKGCDRIIRKAPEMKPFQ